MATYTTYDQVGKAEDVQDVISNISPTDTPMYTAIPTTKSTRTKCTNINKIPSQTQRITKHG